MELKGISKRVKMILKSEDQVKQLFDFATNNAEAMGLMGNE